MNPEIIKTADGSLTLHLKEIDETYHSTHGALNEARYVYIQNGLLKSKLPSIRILEVGFGTGLNTLVTLDTWRQQETIKSIHYTSLEKHPLTPEVYKKLNYGQLFCPEINQEFTQLHEAEWEKNIKIKENFTLHKRKTDLITDVLEGQYDLIYYDAFAPSKQSQMWEDEVLTKVCNTLQQGGIFCTYCAKGDVRRTLKGCGLDMKRLPGPPGKWEMLFGTKR